MSKYKLSICIPTYNREKFISETIQSIIKNNYELENIQISASTNSQSHFLRNIFFNIVIIGYFFG